jgi:hypothetical protein
MTRGHIGRVKPRPFSLSRERFLDSCCCARLKRNSTHQPLVVVSISSLSCSHHRHRRRCWTTPHKETNIENPSDNSPPFPPLCFAVFRIPVTPFFLTLIIHPPCVSTPSSPATVLPAPLRTSHADSALLVNSAFSFNSSSSVIVSTCPS